jgi:hypothetical protein
MSVVPQATLYSVAGHQLSYQNPVETSTGADSTGCSLLATTDEGQSHRSSICQRKDDLP